MSSWPASTSSATGRRRGRCRRSRSASTITGAALRRRTYVGADPVAACPVPPIACVQVPPVGGLASVDQPVLRIARVLAVAACSYGVRRRLLSTASRRSRALEPGASQSVGYDALQPRLATATRRGWWADLERDLELARMTVTARQVAATGARWHRRASRLVGADAVDAAPGALRAHDAVHRSRGGATEAEGVRHDFAEQFPGSLQVLASALRAGHSFNGALGVVVDNVHEPARSELARVVQDDRLGVQPEDAMPQARRRMANRDIEQVALLAELQRTSGGNSAEILDTVVGHDPRAGGDAPTRQDAHRAGSDGAVDPDCASDLPGRVSLARPPRLMKRVLHERRRSVRTRGRRDDGRDRALSSSSASSTSKSRSYHMALFLMFGLSLVAASAVLVLRSFALAQHGPPADTRPDRGLRFSLGRACRRKSHRTFAPPSADLATATGERALARFDGCVRARDALRELLDFGGHVPNLSTPRSSARGFSPPCSARPSWFSSWSPVDFDLRLLVGCVLADADGLVHALRRVQRRARLRIEQIDREVPELVDLLVTTVEAGVGFASAPAARVAQHRGPAGPGAAPRSPRAESRA